MMNTVKTFRLLLNYSQAQVAQRLGISEGSYRAKENGKNKFNELEMYLFVELVNERFPDTTVDNIFLSRFRRNQTIPNG